MNKNQDAQPASPYETSSFSQCLTKQLDNLSLLSRKCSQADTLSGNVTPSYLTKSKLIQKKCQKPLLNKKQKHSSIIKKRQNTNKKLKHLQNRVKQLEREIHSIRRNCQGCPYCHTERNNQRMILDDVQMYQQEELLRLARDYDHANSRESIQFQAIDFTQSLACKTEMDERAWVMIGAMMLIIGSKNMDIDGTINTFKVLSDCVDTVRRQVEKSTEKISLDFYFMKEQMKQNMSFIQGLNFDPFFSKTEKNGLHLQGLNVESVEEFQLIYDQKIKFNINYQSLITNFEKLKQNCWISL